MRDDMRAQAAFEFMTFFGFFALLFLLISVTLLQSQTAQIENKRWGLMTEVCLALRDEINNAGMMGDGYWRRLDVAGYPGQDYVVRVKGATITVSSVDGERECAAVLAYENIRGPGGGEAVLHSGKEVLIRNEGGVIVLEQ